jgi:indolepyruvate ferredoxin oxidoreductase beta subunit
VIDHLAVAGGFAAPQARAEAIRAVREAALADDAGKALDQALLEHGALPRPVKAQPVIWVKKQRSAAS